MWPLRTKANEEKQPEGHAERKGKCWGMTVTGPCRRSERHVIAFQSGAPVVLSIVAHSSVELSQTRLLQTLVMCIKTGTLLALLILFTQPSSRHFMTTLFSIIYIYIYFFTAS